MVEFEGIESRTIINGTLEESLFEIVGVEDADSSEILMILGNKPIIKVNLLKEDLIDFRLFNKMYIIGISKNKFNRIYRQKGLCITKITTKIFIDLKLIRWHGETPVFEIYHMIDKIDDNPTSLKDTQVKVQNNEEKPVTIYEKKEKKWIDCKKIGDKLVFDIRTSEEEKEVTSIFLDKGNVFMSEFMRSMSQDLEILSHLLQIQERFIEIQKNREPWQKCSGWISLMITPGEYKCPEVLESGLRFIIEGILMHFDKDWTKCYEWIKEKSQLFFNSLYVQHLKPEIVTEIILRMMVERKNILESGETDHEIITHEEIQDRVKQEMEAKMEELQEDDEW